MEDTKKELKQALVRELMGETQHITAASYILDFLGTFIERDETMMTAAMLVVEHLELLDPAEEGCNVIKLDWKTMCTGVYAMTLSILEEGDEPLQYMKRVYSQIKATVDAAPTDINMFTLSIMALEKQLSKTQPDIPVDQVVQQFVDDPTWFERIVPAREQLLAEIRAECE